MYYSIDRFEGEFAVIELENRKMLSIPIKALPDGCKEGDIIEVTINQNFTHTRKKNISNIYSDLFEEE